MINLLFTPPKIPEPDKTKTIIFFSKFLVIFQEASISFDVLNWNRVESYQREVMKTTKFTNARIVFTEFVMAPLTGYWFNSESAEALFYGSALFSVDLKISKWNRTLGFTLTNNMGRNHIQSIIRVFPGVDGQWSTGDFEMDLYLSLRPINTKYSDDKSDENKSLYNNEGATLLILEDNMKLALDNFFKMKTKRMTINL